MLKFADGGRREKFYLHLQAISKKFRTIIALAPRVLNLVLMVNKKPWLCEVSRSKDLEP